MVETPPARGSASDGWPVKCVHARMHAALYRFNQHTLHISHKMPIFIWIYTALLFMVGQNHQQNDADPHGERNHAGDVEGALIEVALLHSLPSPLLPLLSLVHLPLSPSPTLIIR
jgi:hypothetical protein